jgi:Zeta toxin/Phage portal protein
MPKILPAGAQQLALPNIGQAGNLGQIRDVSSNYWFSPLQPVKPTAPADLRIRQYQYQPGANIIWTPGAEDTFGTGFWILREVAESWDMLRIVIETVKDRLCAQKGDFRLIPAVGENKKDLKARSDKDKRLPALQNFFKYPDGFHTWEEWLRMWLEDVLVLDAGVVYLERDKKGRIASLPIIDGATINRMLTDQGFTPQAPDVGYQQVLWGLPAKDLTTDDIIYTMRNQRTWKRYGFSPVEQMLVTISIGLRKQDFDLKFYTAGNIPEALCFLPPEMPIDKVTEVQSWYDSILSGDLGNRRRLTFLPGYGSPKDQAFRPNIVFTKNTEAMMKTPWDEWQLRIICNGLGVSPTLMLAQVNRATAQQNAEQAEEEGLEPKMRTIEAMVNRVVQLYFGFDDIEFRYDARRDMDPEKQMTVDTGYLKVAVKSLNESRDDLGLDPYDKTLYPEADEPLVFTQNGPVTLRMALNAATQSMFNSGAKAGGEGAAPIPTEPEPEPAANGNGKKPAKKVGQLGESGVSGNDPDLPVIRGGMSTPATRIAAANLQTAVQNVFRRQKEKATQRAGELLKKKLLITKVRKFNPNHDPATGEFSSGSGLAYGQTTEEKYKKDGKWTDNREKLHQEIINKAIGDKQPAPGRGPVATIMGGGVAVGKSTIRGLCVPPGSDPVVADPDAIKAQLPEYEALKKEDPSGAATVVHEESSVINKQLIAQAIKKRLDIVYDGSFSNSVSSDSLIKALHGAGYKVDVTYADVPTSVAMERALTRAKTSTNPADAGRYVPFDDRIINGQVVEGAKTRHRLAAANFFGLKDKTGASKPDSLRVYDTSGPFGSTPSLFYSKVGDKENIYDPNRFNQFKLKSQGIEN